MDTPARPYLAVFRDYGQDFFKTDCDWEDLETAALYVARITAALPDVESGAVVDRVTGEQLFFAGASLIPSLSQLVQRFAVIAARMCELAQDFELDPCTPSLQADVADLATLIRILKANPDRIEYVHLGTPGDYVFCRLKTDGYKCSVTLVAYVD